MKTTLKILLLFASILTLWSCSDDGSSPNPKPEEGFINFKINEDHGIITLTWTDDKAVDIWRKIGSSAYIKIAEANTSKSLVDDLSSQADNTAVGYRMVAAGGDIYSTAAITGEQKTRICLLSDEQILDLVERTTLRYFTDFAHPCGMARERNTSGDIVTTGGSGFGIMAIVAGAHRNYLSRNDAYRQIRKIVDFLKIAPRFHGAFAHWYNGNTATVQPFSQKDDGADLVETSFLFQGLLCAREYFAEGANADESTLVADIDRLWSEIEWTHFVRSGALMWHWSPNYEFELNLRITGWCEAMMTYVLAASSPTYPIDRTLYEDGFQRGGDIRCGVKFYGIELPIGNAASLGGPLFFAHYTFLGLDPRGLGDSLCSDYFEQNKAHTLINRAYCIDNPSNFFGYGENLWGLTASDCPVDGYAAHSPSNDNGTISPTAAISSIPYTPEESMAVVKYLYRDMGDRMFGEYGFYDALNLSVAADRQIVKSYLAIDQGPIVVMIENYRSQFIWDTFMKNKDVLRGLERLGISHR